MSQLNDETIGQLLNQVMRAYRNLAESRLSVLGMHAGQEMILFKLWSENGVTQSQLASHLHVEPPTVTKMVQRMEAAGLVERRPDSDDGRVSRVYLTKHSRDLEPAVREALRGLEDATVQGLSDMEQVFLRRLLIQLLENLNRANTEAES
jgi:MarR family transcriptional regulator, organic hydroperoxide resistance regulator